MKYPFIEAGLVSLSTSFPPLMFYFSLNKKKKKKDLQHNTKPLNVCICRHLITVHMEEALMDGGDIMLMQYGDGFIRVVFPNVQFINYFALIACPRSPPIDLTKLL